MSTSWPAKPSQKVRWRWKPNASFGRGERYRENSLDRFHAEKFWDRAMREIADILAERGTLPSAEILPALQTLTVRGVALHGWQSGG